MAVDGTGHAVTCNGKSWSAATDIDPGKNLYLTSVSCPSASFCMAGGGYAASLQRVSEGKTDATPRTALRSGTATRRVEVMDDDNFGNPGDHETHPQGT
jgi:hypothetical protein